ncbi:MAG: hypothetical protein ACP5D7_17185 [Limnospira sp.]
MRLWQTCWQNLVYSTRYNPPQFIEVVMLMLSMLLLMVWSLTGQWPYLVLCLSYVIGSSTSMLIREAIFPSSHFQLTQWVAILLLIMGFYTLMDLVIL